MKSNFRGALRRGDVAQFLTVMRIWYGVSAAIAILVLALGVYQKVSIRPLVVFAGAQFLVIFGTLQLLFGLTPNERLTKVWSGKLALVSGWGTLFFGLDMLILGVLWLS